MKISSILQGDGLFAYDMHTYRGVLVLSTSTPRQRPVSQNVKLQGKGLFHKTSSSQAKACRYERTVNPEGYFHSKQSVSKLIIILVHSFQQKCYITILIQYRSCEQ